MDTVYSMQLRSKSLPRGETRWRTQPLPLQPVGRPLLVFNCYEIRPELLWRVYFVLTHGYFGTLFVTHYSKLYFLPSTRSIL
jgi:hypothetical protein